MTHRDHPNHLEHWVEEGRSVILAAAAHLDSVGRALDESFGHVVAACANSKGKVVTTGIGKAGHVARKVSATFASTGTDSIHIHPSDAAHGDLGRVGRDDVVLMFSNSGASAELVRLIAPIRALGATIVAITGDPNSTLAKEADLCLSFGRVQEAGKLGLAPTTSTTVLLVLGDALAMAVLAGRDFAPSDFARFHPAGSLGRSLLRVREVMRTGPSNPIAKPGQKLLDVLHLMSSTPGRPGAVSVVGDDGKLIGFYTDGDLRRQLERAIEDGDLSFLSSELANYMTRNPLTITGDRLVAEAMRILRERRVDQLPVVDDTGIPIGLLDVQDLLDVKVFG